MSWRLVAVFAVGITAMLLTLHWPAMTQYAEDLPHLKVIGEFKRHPAYDKFMSMYPDAQELSGSHETALFLIQQDYRGNTLSLHMLNSSEITGTAPDVIIMCHWSPANHTGTDGERVLGFLDDVDCVREPLRPPPYHGTGLFWQ